MEVIYKDRIFYKMRILVLFSGTRSFSKIIKPTDSVVNLDFSPVFKPDIETDLMIWDYQKYFEENGFPDFIQASPPCTQFSILMRATLENNPDTGLLNKTLEIINYVLTNNSNLKWAIENPVGLMRKQDCMKDFKMITTGYCMYGFPYKKSTDIWTNYELVLRKCCHKRHKVVIKYKPDEDGFNEVDWRYFSKLNKIYGTRMTKQEYRYRIPQALCYEILEQSR